MCSKHFAPDDFIKIGEKKRLKPKAVPMSVTVEESLPNTENLTPNIEDSSLNNEDDIVLTIKVEEPSSDDEASSSNLDISFSNISETYCSLSIPESSASTQSMKRKLT